MMIVTLLAVNLASTAHAACLTLTDCESTQTVQSVKDTHNQTGDLQQAGCDCCAVCGHHHHNHVSMPQPKAAQYTAVITAYSGWSSGVTYLSQLHYPPSKPPKA